MEKSTNPVAGLTLVNPVTRRKLLASGGAALALATFTSRLSAFAQDATPEASPEPQGPTIPPELNASDTDWPVEGQNLKATRLAPKSSIDTDTVSQLGVSWTFDVNVDAPFGSMVANPIVSGDTVFLQDAKSNVYSIDKSTGDQNWSKTYDEDVPSGGPNGIAVGYGLAVFPVGSGDVVALDMESGEEVWHISIQGPRGEGITMAPLIYDNTVYISTIPGAPEGFYQGGMRGFIFAIDVNDGSVIWYLDTTTDNLWGNARVNSGGGLWHPPSVDDDGNLYVGIGNAGPFPGVENYPAGSSRPGPNDYMDSLMRIDPETASIDWYLEVKPHDLFDLDNQLTPILTTIQFDDADTLVAITSGKHGLVVAAKAETGDEIWRTPVGKHQNDDATELPGDNEDPLTVLPGFLGGVETPMAIADGVIFAPVVNLAVNYTGSTAQVAAGNLYDGTGELVALDAATGGILWDVEIPSMPLGGATVANDVVFTGAVDGVVRGYNVADGTLVFTYQATAGINASFAVSGDYLFVPAGSILSPSSDTVDPAPDMQASLVAFMIGGEVQGTPPAAGTPSAVGTPSS